MEGETMRKIKKEGKKFIVIIFLISWYMLIFMLIFMLLFECLFIHRDLDKEYPEYGYSDSIFFEGIFHPVFGQMGGDWDFILMFQWKYDELLSGINLYVYDELESSLKSKEISEYKVDEQMMTVRMTVNEMTENQREGFAYLLNQLKRTCRCWYIFTYKKLPEKPQAEVTLYDKAGNQIQEVPVMSQKEAEKEEEKEKEQERELAKKAYNEGEVKYLEEIISRSKMDKEFDFSDENIIGGVTENRKEGNKSIEFLNLSAYSDITGELDLSWLRELKYVVLKGMKIDSAILPYSLVSIETDSFEDCKNIKEITVPSNVTTLNNPVFSGCKNLKKVIFEGDAPRVLKEDEEIFGKTSDDLVIYRRKLAKGWQETVWDKYDVRIIDE